MLSMIKGEHAEYICDTFGKRSLWRITWRKTEMIAVWDSQLRLILTFLTEQMATERGHLTVD
jgi:hypothetical protein